MVRLSFTGSFAHICTNCSQIDKLINVLYVEISNLTKCISISIFSERNSQLFVVYTLVDLEKKSCSHQHTTEVFKLIFHGRFRKNKLFICNWINADSCLKCLLHRDSWGSVTVKLLRSSSPRSSLSSAQCLHGPIGGDSSQETWEEAFQLSGAVIIKRK